MKWIIINEDLRVRLEDGKPKHSSRQGVLLEQAIEVVDFWLRTNENAEAQAWLDGAEDELDLQKRIARMGPTLRELLWLPDETTPRPEPASTSELRARAVSEREEERNTQREFTQGEEAFRLGDYDKALEHFRPLAKKDNRSAYFYLGQMCEKGEGVPQDYVKAYVFFDIAAHGKIPYPVDEAKSRIEKLMSAEELQEARRIVRYMMALTIPFEGNF